MTIVFMLDRVCAFDCLSACTVSSVCIVSIRRIVVASVVILIWSTIDCGGTIRF